MPAAGGKSVAYIREDKRILSLVDKVASARGSDRSTVYREAIRLYLARIGALTKDEAAMLGLGPQGRAEEAV